MKINYIIYDDFLCNFDLGYDRAIRCHNNLDAIITAQGDIILTRSAQESVLQKLFLWLSIKQGEIPGEPELGCCIYKYFYKKSIPDNYALLEREIAYQINKWIPELGLNTVSCEGDRNTEGRMESISIVILSSDYGKIDVNVSPEILEDISIGDIAEIPWSDFPWADFSNVNNSQLQDLIL
jgi:hypothetical protein